MRFPPQIGKRKYLKFQELGDVAAVEIKVKFQELVKIFGEDAVLFFKDIDNYCKTSAHLSIDINDIACKLVFKGFTFADSFKILTCLSDIARERAEPLPKVYQVLGGLLSPYKPLSDIDISANSFFKLS